MILEALIEYRLCMCVRRGGFRLRGLCPCCKIHRGDYVHHVVKIMGGGLCPCCKIHGGGGIMSTYTNFSRGGVVRGDIVLH